MAVLDVTVGEVGRKKVDNGLVMVGRKRKRVVDEDADSAAGSEHEEEDEDEERGMGMGRKPAPSTVDSLSKDMKEVYALLQRGTARGRLLAEQVCTGTFIRHCCYSR